MILTKFEIVDLEVAHLKRLQMPIQESYFSKGSAAYCLLVDGEPVFAGGIVNLEWNRGEVWIAPTPFFKQHVKTCFRILKEKLPEIAIRGKFRRVQATCTTAVSEALFLHLGFEYEGTLKFFGPNGEACKMFSRVFPLRLKA